MSTSTVFFVALLFSSFVGACGNGWWSNADDYYCSFRTPTSSPDNFPNKVRKAVMKNKLKPSERSPEKALQFSGKNPPVSPSKN